MIVAYGLISAFSYILKWPIYDLSSKFLILLIPLLCWYYISNKIVLEKNPKDKKLKVDTSSVILGIYGGIIVGIHMAIILGALHLDMYHIFILLFLLEAVVLQALYKSRVKKLGSVEAKIYLMKNLAIATLAFVIMIILTLLLLASPFMSWLYGPK